ncbi:MAG TPA: hypothetical protein VF432_31120 [Thermoanaerobaculia bacterium]
MKRTLVLLTLSSLLLLGAAPVPDAKPQRVTDWVFEGCFQPPNNSQCYDVYVHNGAYWICRACGTTGTPDAAKCRPMTGYEQWFGLWCS